MEISSLDLALHACRKMDAKGAEELRVLRIDDELYPFDFVVLTNGRSDRQSQTLIDEVYHFCKRHKIAHSPVEGESGWYLIDCHQVIVHAFIPELREYYRLDSLWSGAKEVQHEALLAALPDLDKASA
jgi:ribosome-associated protein